MHLGLSQEKAAEAIGLTGRTFRNWKHAPEGDGRLDRKDFTSPLQFAKEEKDRIIERFCQLDVCDLSLPQAFYKLLDEEGLYLCSLSTLYRIFREAKLMGKRTPTRAARLRSKPTSYSAGGPNEVWTWDITYLRTSRYTGMFYYAYVIVDIYSRAIISARVYSADNAQFAAGFLKDAFEKNGIAPGQLVVHSDNGSSMKADKTLAVLASHDVQFSHSRPRVSNDNPYSESLFRTLKYSGEYLYPRDGFEDIAHAQRWIDGFVEYYNEYHRHRGIRMVTPGSRHRGEDKEILRRRARTMEQARKLNPNRWVQGRTLDCSPINAVYLNPDNGQLEEASA